MRLCLGCQFTINSETLDLLGAQSLIESSFLPRLARLDGLPLSVELRGSDVDHPETILPHHWDRIFSPEERERRNGLNRILRALRGSLNEANHVFEHSLPRLARLLDECPFEDVQTLITEFFQAVGKVRTGQNEARRWCNPRFPVP